MIAEHLRDIRGELTQEAFAKKCGVTRAALANYETGRTIPGRWVCRKIEEACNLPSGYFDGSGPNEPRDRQDVDRQLRQMKSHFDAGTDEELAAKLRVGRSTVTSWRRRGHVPAAYLRRLEDMIEAGARQSGNYVLIASARTMLGEYLASVSDPHRSVVIASELLDRVIDGGER